MKAKFVTTICIFLLGSVFSLSYTLYCDFWMTHQRGSVAQQAVQSCHEMPEHSKKDAPEACPILLNLEDSQALAAHDHVRVEKQSSSPIYFSDLSATVPLMQKVTTARLLPDRFPEPLPLYLRNPVLRI